MNIFAICIILVVLWNVAAIPPDWQIRVNEAQMVFSDTMTSDINLMPSIANGYIGTVVLSDTIYAAGVYVNNADIWEEDIGSQRARFPSPMVINVANADLSVVGYALDFEKATFYRRYQGSGVLVEQRWYAHQMYRSLLVHEIWINSTLDEDYQVQLQVIPSSPSQDFNFVNITGSGFNGVCGSIVKAETPATELVQACMITAVILDEVMAAANQESLFTFVTSIRSSLDSANVQDAATSDWMFGQSHNQTLHTDHMNAWNGLWTGGVEVTGDLTLSVNINASLYAMLSSVRSDWPWPASPGGLSTNGYWGRAFWDTEIWILSSLISQWPSLAKNQLNYRYQRIDMAKYRAKEFGYKGCLIPWESGFTGTELGNVAQDMEVHIGADVAIFAKRYWDLTHDIDWLQSQGHELVHCIAEYWTSKVVQEDNGSYSINHVIPPDEYAIGFPIPEGVSNNPYTNYGAANTMEFANNMSIVLGKQPNKQWDLIADNITILFDNVNQLHVEYEGFPIGNTYICDCIKQADVVLLGYPWDLPMSQQVRYNDLAFYEKMTDPNGPAMTWSMDAIAWLELKDYSDVAYERFNRSTANIQPPFAVWTITPNPYNHPNDRSCFNFITGAGGWMQAVINGYSGLRIRYNELFFDPQLPINVTTMKLRGVQYMGSTISVFYDATLVTVQLVVEGSTPLYVTDSSGQTSSLTSQPTTFAVGSFTLHE